MERPQLIRKGPADVRLAPNLADYDAQCRDFTWDEARAALDGLPGGGSTSPTRPSTATRPARCATASRCARLARTAPRVDLTYGELARLTNRFANVLRGLGVGKGDRVFVLAGPHPRAVRRGARRAEERHRVLPAVLGLRPRADRHAPRRSARARCWSPPPRSTGARCADPRPAADAASTCCWSARTAAPRDVARHARPRRADGRGVRPTSRSRRPTPEDPALLHFTSGTTGTPKGAIHVHDAVVAHHATGRYALDLHPDDVFWCTADPGWVTGTSYGIIAPLPHGVDQRSSTRPTSTPSAGTASSQRAAGHRLVHRADRDPHADEGRARISRAAHDLSARCASSPASASR